MNPKVSHLIRAGAIVHTVNGGVFRCTSKIASSEGIRFRLADLQGKPVPTPADFRPISPALARFAAWMRLAYNKDFDLYVKESIKAAGLPVDPTMNWSRFFAAKVAPKLMSKDPEIQDEAIHQIIVKTLVERNALSNFSAAIKKFPPHIQEKPLDRQVTVFLMQIFNWRIREANDYIKDFIFQDQTSSMWAEGDNGEGAEDVNLLDNAESTTSQGGYDTVDTDVDVAHFRKGFERFLDEKFRTETVGQYLALFDLIYDHLREGDIPGAGATVRTAPTKETRENEMGEAEAIRKEIPTLFSEWQELTESKKSHSWFKVLFANLPKIIDTYITEHLKNEEVSPFIEIMRLIGQSRKEQQPELQPIMGGLKLAEEQYPINQTVETDSGSSGSGSGGSGFSMPSLGEVGAGAGDIGELAELAPLAVAAASKKVVGDSENSSNVAYDDGYKSGQGDRRLGNEALKVNNQPGASDYSKNYCQGYYDGYHDLTPKPPVPGLSIYRRQGAQWEVPKCKACGKTEVKDCLACHEKFCNDCILNHHANNPSHDRVASKAAAFHYINGKQHKLGGCSICKKAELGETTNGNDDQPIYVDEAPKEHIGLTPPEMQDFIADCIGSGLYEEVGDSYFSWQGCDYCKGGGGDVTDFKGYRNLTDAQAPNREELEYEFQLCNECLNKLVYGEE